MLIPVALKGFILGFAIAAPVGPIALLCIRRALIYGSLAGFFSGLGAATADTMYGIVAAYGVTIVANTILAHQILLRVLGGAFLLYMGIKTFFSTPTTSAVAPYTKGNLLAAYLSTFMLTITNPLTIISFAALFAALGLAGSAAKETVAVSHLIMGVFLGSTAWWLSLSTLVGLIRKKISLTTIGWLNKFSGCIIILCAFLTFLSICWQR